MNIGYLIPEWPGQSHVWAWREICHLRELGLDLTILSTREPKELGKHNFAFAAHAETVYLWPISMSKIILNLIWEITFNLKGFLSCIQLGLSLPVYKKPTWKSVLPLLIPACQLAREVKRRKIQHLHTPMPGNSAVLCMMVKRLTGIPYSLTIVAAFDHWGGAMQEKIADANFVSLVAQWMVNEMPKAFPMISPTHYSITRHGVDTKKWIPDPNKPFNKAQPKRILSIGRLAACKGFDVLLEAAALAKSKDVPFQLRIIGEGPERSQLEQLVDRLNLNAEVVLLGSLGEEQCLAEARAADLFVLASHHEPLGVVYLEAMATEVATIGTAAGGVLEIITDGVDGLLVPPNQPEKLADAIVEVLTNDQMREQLAKAGRRTVIEKFDSRIGGTMLRDLILQSSQTRESPNWREAFRELKEASSFN